MKTLIIMNEITRIAAFICITICAIYFQKTGLLWWYLVPLFMGLSYETKKGDDTE